MSAIESAVCELTELNRGNSVPVGHWQDKDCFHEEKLAPAVLWVYLWIIGETVNESFALLLNVLNIYYLNTYVSCD